MPLRSPRIVQRLRRRVARLLVVPLLLVAAGSAGVPPLEMAVPVQLQYPLFLKILTYDRALPARVGDELVIGVVYQERVRESYRVKDDFLDVMNGADVGAVQGVAVRGVAVEHGSLERETALAGIDVLYLTPMRAPDLARVTALARAHSVSTLTGVPEYVEQGIAIGVGVDGRRPRILVNLGAARAEGAQLSAQLLRLAHVIDS